VSLLILPGSRVGTARSRVGHSSENEISCIRRRIPALKGTSANLGAERLSPVAHRLELVGRSEDLSEAPSALAELEQEFDLLVEFVSGRDEASP